jgi:hypothetical protein
MSIKYDGGRGMTEIWPNESSVGFMAVEKNRIVALSFGKSRGTMARPFLRAADD